MDEEYLKCIVSLAVDIFLEKDKELLNLSHGVHEQAISHRIAVYLELFFSSVYHIDCEYNKQGSQNEKTVKNVSSVRCRCCCASCKSYVKKNRKKQKLIIRPDIIVHKRRENGLNDNILVIEIKKRSECFFDQEKLKEMTKVDGRFGYKLGVFIYFPESIQKFKWFINGVEKQ